MRGGASRAAFRRRRAAAPPPSPTAASPASSAGPAPAARAEASLEVRDELCNRLRPVVELGGERDEASQVVLARDLALAETVGNAIEKTLGACHARYGQCNRDRARPTQALEQLAGRLAREQRRSLEREPRRGERLLEVGRPRVRAIEQRDLLVGHALVVEVANAFD